MSGGFDIPSHMLGADWHMHEMVFGYTTAVIAGFLMTAVPNWTGRMPVIGWPVAGLSGLWLAGRVALLVSAYLPIYLAPVIDVSFMIVLGAVILREIIAGKNWKNLVVLGMISLLTVANIIFHIEAITGAAFGGYGSRMGVGVIIVLISLIGGRVIPSFTRNWLAKRGAHKLPTPMNKFDRITLLVGVVTIVSWILWPEFVLARWLAGLAAILHFIRLSRWLGWRTLAEPLVAILHVGYFFIPLGFAMIALGDLLPGWGRASQIPHAWTVGAVGIVTLAVMTRASLGHSGRALTATRSVSVVYLLIITAVLCRIAAEMLPYSTSLLHLSGTAWILGFAGFALVYFPTFTRPKA